MARIRPRGHAPVLRIAHARGGFHQVEPAEDHCRWYGLALSRRAQARAEGVNTSVIASEAVALACAASLLGAPVVIAAGGVLETPSVRLRKQPVSMAGIVRRLKRAPAAMQRSTLRGPIV